MTVNLNLRAPLLHRWPARRRRTAAGRRLLRALALLLILTAVMVAGLIVHFRLLPPESAPPLYALYDHVVLPLWGYTFTRYFAYSVILYGLLLVGLIWWIAVLLFDARPLTALQIWRLRRDIRQGRAERVLRWARRYRRLGFRPHLPRLVALDAWQTALDRGSPPAAADHLQLVIDLESLFDTTTARQIDLLDRWLQTMLSAFDADDSDRDAMFAALADSLDHLRGLPADDDGSAAVYNRSVLVADARRLLALSRRGRWRGPVSPGRLPDLWPLLAHIEARQRTMTQAYAHLQRDALNRTLSETSDRTAASFPVPGGDLAALAAAGRCTRHLAAGVALLANDPALLERDLHAAESLRLALRAAGLAAARPWAAVLGDIPAGAALRDPAPFRGAALLRRTLQDEQIGKWGDQRNAAGRPLLSRDDLTTARRIGPDSLLRAAHTAGDRPHD